MGHKNNVNPSLFIQLAKVQQQNEWEKKPGVSAYGPWICNCANSRILELFLRPFCHLI